MKRILLLTLCLCICLSGCGKNTGEQVSETPKEEVQLLTPTVPTDTTDYANTSTVENYNEQESEPAKSEAQLDAERVNQLREEYIAKINLNKIKDTAADIRADIQFDINPYFNQEYFTMTDDLYNVKILHRDVTLFGTTLGTLLDSLKPTGLVQDYYDLSTVMVAPYHEVRMLVGTSTRYSETHNLGDKELTGSVYAINLTTETIPASECLISGYSVLCDAGVDLWGFSNEAGAKRAAADEQIEVNDQRISEEAYNGELGFFTSFGLVDDKTSSEFKTTFNVLHALDYLNENYTKAVLDSNPEISFEAGGETFDLNDLTYAQAILSTIETADEADTLFVPTIDLRSIFEYKDYDYVTLVYNCYAVLDDRFNNGVEISMQARHSNEAVNIWDTLFTSISNGYGSWNNNGDVFIDGILVSGSEQDFMTSIEKYASSHGTELVITDGYSDDEQRIEMDTDSWRITATTEKEPTEYTIEDFDWSRK